MPKKPKQSATMNLKAALGVAPAGPVTTTSSYSDALVRRVKALETELARVKAQLSASLNITFEG